MKSLKKVLAVVPMVAVATLATVSPANAQSYKEAINNVSKNDPTGGNVKVENLVGTVMNTMFWVVGILSVIMLIYGGIKYITSGGSSSKLNDAKNTILYAIVGLVVSLIAVVIINFVNSTVGVK